MGPTLCSGTKRQHTEFLYGNLSVDQSAGRTRNRIRRIMWCISGTWNGANGPCLNHGFVVGSIKFGNATATHLVLYTGICLGMFKINGLTTTTVIYAFSSHTC